MHYGTVVVEDLNLHGVEINHMLAKIIQKSEGHLEKVPAVTINRQRILNDCSRFTNHSLSFDHADHMEGNSSQ